MNITERNSSRCEICGSTHHIEIFDVLPSNNESKIYACQTCSSQIENPNSAEASHWRCLNESIWSEIPAVQVVSWRMLNYLIAEPWASDLLDSMYLDEDNLRWANDGLLVDDFDDSAHKDCNGVLLQSGDTVTLIKDLDVKGAGFTAKRGTAVRNIMLVADNTDQIEGKVNGQQLVLLTKFVKKTN